jgi:hypothetical protein
MNTKEIHDNLLSLFLRGLGVWLLYLATGWFLRFWDTLWAHVTGGYIDWYALFHFFGHFLVAAYFILGAPPFLKWATCRKAATD